MLVVEAACVRWQLGSAPNKLKIFPSLLLSECLEHIPEHLDMSVAFIHIIGRDLLQRFACDVFGTASSELYILPGQELKDGWIDDEGDTFSHPVHLLVGLVNPCLYHLVDILKVVLMSHFLLSATWAEFNCLSV